MPLVAVDNGHGMNTAGKRTPPLQQDLVINGVTVRKAGEVIHEKEWNRAVADRLIIALNRCNVQTLDVAPGLSDVSIASRYTAANNAKADLFISIHYNALNAIWNWGKSTPQKGYTLMFVSQYASQKTKDFAKVVQDEIARVVPFPNNGVASDYAYMGINVGVLRNTNMPAILSEYGFMDLWEHAQYMLNPHKQDEAAEAMCKGICKYLGVAYVPPQSQPQPAPEPEPTPTPTDKGKYYAVQLGAYEAKANAVDQLNKAKQAGFGDAYIILKDTANHTYTEEV